MDVHWENRFKYLIKIGFFQLGNQFRDLMQKYKTELLRKKRSLTDIDRLVSERDYLCPIFLKKDGEFWGNTLVE